MGRYTRRVKPDENGYPVFTMTTEGGQAFFLNRAGDGSGNWFLTDHEHNIGRNRGLIMSKSASELPTEGGIIWQYSHNGWHDDNAIVCTEVGES